MQTDKYFIWLIIGAVAVLTPPLPADEFSVQDDWAGTGKLIVKGEDWSVVFSKADGALLIRSSLEYSAPDDIKIIPLTADNVQAQGITTCKLISQDKEKIKIAANFTANTQEIQGEFLIDARGTVKALPAQNMNGLRIYSAIAYGVIPNRYLNDDIYKPADYPDSEKLNLPAENILMGLLQGENKILITVWPTGGQKIRLIREEEPEGKNLFQAMEVALAGREIYVGSLRAAGIWHAEDLTADYLEKDISLDWKLPFPARWQCQLKEGGEFWMTYFLKEKVYRCWRPMLGEYKYPINFEGDKVIFHLSKKCPPCGAVLIYPLEGSRDTPAAFAEEYQGDTIDVLNKVNFQPHNSADYLGVNWCTGRYLLCHIFAQSRPGIQIRDQEFLNTVLQDFRWTFQSIKNRITEYENYLQDMHRLIDSWRQQQPGPPCAGFFDDMTAYLDELQTEYRAVTEGLSPQQLYQHDIKEVVEKLNAIIADNELAFPCLAVSDILYSIKLWERAHHDGGKTFGCYNIKWHQEVGKKYVDQPLLLDYVEKIRAKIRDLEIGCWWYETIRK